MSEDTGCCESRRRHHKGLSATIPGVSDTTVAKLLSEIGDIRRFPNADKLANFAHMGPEVLVWASNAVTGQHDISALEKVVNGLKEIDGIDGDYDDIVKFLEDMGKIASSRG